MRFRIRHVTVYRYDKPVILGSHVLRMQPRRDGFLSMDSFALSVHPKPAELRPALDLEGNLVHHARFEGETQELRISFRSSGETHARPLFSPRLDAGAERLPPVYGAESHGSAGYLWAVPSDPVKEFSAGAAEEARGETLPFLDLLNRRLRDGFTNGVRPTGDPLDPEFTLRQGKGSCRDLAVLFVSCCRMQGIAARFVSGYIPAQAGDRQHMHAWTEVYLPGAGWCAFDPTRGTVAGEEHVAVAAAAEPAQAAPITGSFAATGPEAARSEMEVDLQVETERV